MTLPFDVDETAERIVAPEMGRCLGFPRDIEAAALTMPVSVELIPDLTPRRVDEWLCRHVGWDRAPVTDGRAVRGCLVAHRSHALIFLEEAETDDERRFTLAHELAHFHGHYLAARELAIARLGPAVIEVLDGHRLASHAERLVRRASPMPSRRLSGHTEPGRRRTGLLARRSDGGGGRRRSIRGSRPGAYGPEALPARQGPHDGDRREHARRAVRAGPQRCTAPRACHSQTLKQRAKLSRFQG